MVYRNNCCEICKFLKTTNNKLQTTNYDVMAITDHLDFIDAKLFAY